MPRLHGRNKLDMSEEEQGEQRDWARVWKSALEKWPGVLLAILGNNFGSCSKCNGLFPDGFEMGTVIILFIFKWVILASW